MSRQVKYKLVGVTRGRIIEQERARTGAPSEGVMISWAKERGCLFVGRYYPKLKGWRVLKIDRAVQITTPQGRKVWKNYGRGQRIYPSSDAMAMHLMMLLGNDQRVVD